jgi:uncharacterized RDD family membrane protein YckC
MTVANAARRLASACYDGLLVLALLMVTTALLQLTTHGRALIYASIGPWVYAYHGALAAALISYFYVGWTRKGQTLGMKAWGLRLLRTNGQEVDLRAVLIRLAIAGPVYLLVVGGALYCMRTHGHWLWLAIAACPFTANFVWHAWTRSGTLEDRLSGTRMVYLTPAER